MRHYELMVILDPDVEERTVAPALDQFLSVVKKDGGTFAGFHSASDTWHGVPAYLEMLGGEFIGHPAETSATRCRRTVRCRTG